MQGIAPQNRHVASLTHAFLNVHWDQKKPLLLGYSGGPDSKALLYALLECGVVPHLAHVDHGWRSESADEAEALRCEAEKLGCPFYTVRLHLNHPSEDEARKARFAFFQSLPYEILLLGHQADDLAETVLKRVLEGAHLPFLGGMEPVSHQYGMEIWRPLLTVRRSEILEFLEERSLKPIFDPTNADPVYLRARMRLEIFPFLNQRFGKETTGNLALLSERARELHKYLDKRIESAPLYKGPWGTLADLQGFERIEQRHLLQKIARDEALLLSREMLEMILDWVEKGAESRHLVVKKKKIFVDKGRIFLFSLTPKDSNSDL